MKIQISGDGMFPKKLKQSKHPMSLDMWLRINFQRYNPVETIQESYRMHFDLLGWLTNLIYKVLKRW